jgi:two-component system sensor histidine kinase/response regulator
MDIREQTNILIAEDDQSLIRFLRHNLETEGYRPTIVENGRDLLRLAFTMQPDLIVLDVGLPDTDGLTLCRQLKHDARTTDIPVLFLTGRDDIDDRVAGLNAGAQDYLVKPFDMQELQARLRAILRSREEIDQVKTHFNQRQDNFLAILNHEMKAPLTVINMASQILAENTQISEPRREQLLKSIHENAGTLTHIIEDLLYLTHPSRHLKTTNVRNLIVNVVEECRPHVQEYGLHLLSRIPTDLPSLVVDEQQFRRMLGHLVDNAIKFTPRGGIVTITAAIGQQGTIITSEPGIETEIATSTPQGLMPPTSTEPWMLISVKDTGIGISPENQRHVFEPFYQVDSTSTRPAQGLGLGLAVVAAFVRSHHGHLAVRSGNGLGTTIHIALPLHQIIDRSQHHDTLPMNDPEGA